MYNAIISPMESTIVEILKTYHDEAKEELDKILSYWIKHTHDVVHGGFIGQIDENNVGNPASPKGSVLNSRILWSFSAAYNITQNAEHLHLARIAFNYLKTHFVDEEFGGVYWTVNAQGQPLDTKKQVYAIAFAIYGCCAYYTASRSEEAKSLAVRLFETIEANSFDNNNTGYFEAFTRDWGAIEDGRLSAKDANEKKTMNTHLHVLEAYTSLYRIWPGEKLKWQIRNLLNNFLTHIADHDSGHLRLFFDEAWYVKGSTISYGHDIEAAWLLLEAAETIDSASMLEDVKRLSLKLSSAASKGLDEDGGLWYEFEPATQHLIKEKHWWVQAEAMVGFLNAWQLTKNKSYLDKSTNSWAYTKAFIIDPENGEWFWGRNGDGLIMPHQDKVGIWKCPYHNSRACLEIMRRTCN
jgi:mannobiose 2-epimerase